jgi:hypothetical protein
MMRYRLRTLLIVLALGPPVLAWGHWKYEQYLARQRLIEFVRLQLTSNSQLPLPPGARLINPQPKR